MANQRQVNIEQLVGAALVVVISLGGFFLFLLTDFDSLEQSTDNLTRFIWAATHTIAPTSEFDILIEFLVAAVGFVTISRVDIRAAILATFVLLFGTSFVLAWFAAPV